MTSAQLLSSIRPKLDKAKVKELANFLVKNDFSVTELIDLTFHQEEQVGFRAAWILEEVYTKHFDAFLLHAPYFFEKFPHQNNFSARRHFCKILAFISRKKAPVPIQILFNAYQTEILAETVFGWLINENEPVAIKAHCLNILANLSQKHSWIKDELVQTMDFLVDKESIAFYGRVKQIRKQLGLGSLKGPVA